jgi:hypothetical protein
MTRNLKKILLKIGCLSKSDQRWIMAKLSESEKAIFRQMQVEKLLSTARRFRTLQNEQMPLPLSPQFMPPNLQSLANYCPLYIAIVLEQGQFSWQQQFLSLFDHKGEIETLFCSDKLMQLTSATKQALYKHWEKSQTFDRYLEQHHG